MNMREFASLQAQQGKAGYILLFEDRTFSCHDSSPSIPLPVHA